MNNGWWFWTQKTLSFIKLTLLKQTWAITFSASVFFVISQAYLTKSIATSNASKRSHFMSTFYWCLCWKLMVISFIILSHFNKNRTYVVQVRDYLFFSCALAPIILHVKFWRMIGFCYLMFLIMSSNIPMYSVEFVLFVIYFQIKQSLEWLFKYNSMGVDKLFLVKRFIFR